LASFASFDDDGSLEVNDGTGNDVEKALGILKELFD
jgi:hypothetical protein